MFLKLIRCCLSHPMYLLRASSTRFSVKICTNVDVNGNTSLRPSQMPWIQSSTTSTGLLPAETLQGHSCHSAVSEKTPGTQILAQRYQGEYPRHYVPIGIHGTNQTWWAKRIWPPGSFSFWKLGNANLHRIIWDHLPTILGIPFWLRYHHLKPHLNKVLFKNHKGVTPTFQAPES